MNVDWQKDAACRNMDPALFFPGAYDDQTMAQETCRSCVVREECLTFGIGMKYGIWGGKNQLQRKGIRRAS